MTETNNALDALRAQIAAIQSGEAPVAAEVDASDKPDESGMHKKLRLRLERRAHYLLAKRDYARAELAQKLQDRPLYKANSAKAQFKRYVENQRDEQAKRWGDDFEDEPTDDAVAQTEPASSEDLPQEPPAELVAEWVVQLIDGLETQGYLSDSRYCETYVRSKCNAGQGPIKIQQRLRQNSVDSVLINEEMAKFDWYEQAKAVRAHKFGQSIPDDYQQRAKQMRFLQSRGFDSDQCRYATE